MAPDSCGGTGNRVVEKGDLHRFTDRFCAPGAYAGALSALNVELSAVEGWIQSLQDLEPCVALRHRSPCQDGSRVHRDRIRLFGRKSNTQDADTMIFDGDKTYGLVLGRYHPIGKEGR